MRRADAAAALAATLLAAPLAGQPAAVPPPVEQQTADCARPVYATDQLVCGEARLRALDSALAAALAGFDAPSSSAWFEPQPDWFRRRSRCAFADDHARCAEAAYRERLALLRGPGPSLTRQAARCASPGIAAILADGDRIWLVDQAGQIMGMAAAAGGEASPWQPFLLAARRKQSLTIRTATGETLRCRLPG